MKKVNLVEFSDLLSYSTTIGYDWNQVHGILIKDGVVPMYESKTKEFELEWLECSQSKKCKEYNYSEDSFKILIGFMKHEKINKMTLLG